MITELLKIEALQTTTVEQVMEAASAVNSFIQKQDGFINAELIKAIEGNTWYFIYHIENFEKVKAVGEKIRGMKLFEPFTPLIVPGSMSVTFYSQLNSWLPNAQDVPV